MSQQLLRLVAATAALTLTAVGCAEEPGNRSTAVAAACDSPDGVWTNLEGESADWRADVGNRVEWTDEGGCAINLEYLFHGFSMATSTLCRRVSC